MIKMTIGTTVVEVPTVDVAAELLAKLGRKPRALRVAVKTTKHVLTEAGRRSKARRLRRHWKKARALAVVHGCSVREASRHITNGTTPGK